MPLETQQEPNNQQARSRAELVRELKRVADWSSTEFHTFWQGMTAEEKMLLLHGAEEPGPAGSR